MKNISQLLVAVLVAVGLFSCNVLDITKKRYSNGYYISTSGDRKVNTQDHIVKEKASDVAVIAKENKKVQTAETIASENCDNVATIENNQDASTENNKNISNKTKTDHKKKQRILANSQAVFAVRSSKLAVSKLQMNERTVIEKQANTNNSRIDDHQLLLIILAFLLPPLAVFLKKGLDTIFWISLILTLLFWVPGVIFALLVVLDAI